MVVTPSFECVILDASARGKSVSINRVREGKEHHFLKSIVVVAPSGYTHLSTAPSTGLPRVTQFTLGTVMRFTQGKVGKVGKCLRRLPR